MKRIIKIILILCFLFTTTSYSQFRHEFSLNAGGGLSALQYNVNEGNRKLLFGGSGGLGYTYFFNPKLGLGTGIDLGVYRSSSKISEIEFQHSNLVDDENELFDLYSTLTDYTEHQQALFVQIPVMLQFQQGVNHMFYASAGGKIGIPVKGSYATHGAKFVNRGFYHNEANWADDQGFGGFGTFTDKDISDGKIDLGISFMLSAEAGMKWKLNPTMALYTGVYVDYGLNSVYDESKKMDFIKYNPLDAENFSNYSVLQSTYNSGGVQKSFTDKVVPLAVGFKFRLTIGVADK